MIRSDFQDEKISRLSDLDNAQASLSSDQTSYHVTAVISLVMVCSCLGVFMLFILWKNLVKRCLIQSEYSEPSRNVNSKQQQ